MPVGAGAPELGIGLVGCGEVCEYKHLPALQRVRGASVVGLADPDSVRRARVGDRFGVSLRVSSVEELLESEAVQIIGVLAPPAEHARLALRVIAAGRHLLVEKPLCLSLDE